MASVLVLYVCQPVLFQYVMCVVVVGGIYISHVLYLCHNVNYQGLCFLLKLLESVSLSRCFCFLPKKGGLRNFPHSVLNPFQGVGSITSVCYGTGY
jgi:hypothetical protein